MSFERDTTEIFGKCYRLMHRVGAGMGDQFFVDLWSRESDGLLSDFIVFLKKKGETLGQIAASKVNSEEKKEPIVGTHSAKILYSKGFVRHELASWQAHVAQCRRRINNRIEKILELLEIFKHTGQTDAITPLLLERELLKLQLATTEPIAAPKRAASGKGDQIAVSEKQKSRPGTEIQLTEAHKQILQFVQSKTANGGDNEAGKKIQNTEIFAHFPSIHRRTLKRKLSDLVSSGSLRRTSQGKQVHYATI